MDPSCATNAQSNEAAVVAKRTEKKTKKASNYYSVFGLVLDSTRFGVVVLTIFRVNTEYDYYE